MNIEKIKDSEGCSVKFIKVDGEYRLDTFPINEILSHQHKDLLKGEEKIADVESAGTLLVMAPETVVLSDDYSITVKRGTKQQDIDALSDLIGVKIEVDRNRFTNL